MSAEAVYTASFFFFFFVVHLPGDESQLLGSGSI